MSVGYEKLLIALENNELYHYLTAKEKYRIFNENEKNFTINNDYLEVSNAINKYGEVNNEFAIILNREMNNILKNNKIGEIYSVCQLIRLQIIKNSFGKSKFDFIDETLLRNLKAKILEHKEEYENLKMYESEQKDRGMMQVFEVWNDEIYRISGQKIL